LSVRASACLHRPSRQVRPAASNARDSVGC
jgi:hypothetical protein